MYMKYRLYEVLVNRTPGIRQRYLRFRETQHGRGRG